MIIIFLAFLHHRPKTWFLKRINSRKNKNTLPWTNTTILLKSVHFLTNWQNKLVTSLILRKTREWFLFLVNFSQRWRRTYVFWWCERLKINAITFPTFFPFEQSSICLFSITLLAKGQSTLFPRSLFLSPSSNFSFNAVLIELTLLQNIRKDCLNG